MSHVQPQVDQLITLALAEDIGTGDQTSEATIAASTMGTARILAKEPLVLAGLPYFTRVFALLDPSVVVEASVLEGTAVPAMTVVGRLSGPARSLLMGERVALNILQRLCGTATLTRKFVEALEGTRARVTDTRKTTPGMRVMQKYAVRTAGGSNHRFGLDSGLLIKDNHIQACGSLRATVEQARAQAPHGLKIEVEARTMAEVAEAIEATADIIMLDNMSNADMVEAVAQIRRSAHPTVIEASGNLTLDRVRAVAETGVDLLSVGALTHSAIASDLSMKFP
ncbi:MAG: nicotinate-nucleotide pyrophosphorylase (carboxylating) [Myxococcota bacterium]|jgi:nicotinate-nucleotide pyrophosphorylase (carboxylating)